MLPDVPALRHVVVIDDGSDADISGYGGVTYDDALAEGSPDRDFPERSADDSYILYTGGTTGNPKGVLWRHEDVWRVLGGGINFVTGEQVADEWQQAREGKAGECWCASRYRRSSTARRSGACCRACSAAARSC